jgi:GAF domain-containing protein
MIAKVPGDEREAQAVTIDTGDVIASIHRELQRYSLENAALRGLFLSMSQVCNAIESPPEDTEILQLLSEQLENVLKCIQAEAGSLLILDESTQDLTFVVVHGVAASGLAWERLGPGVGIAGWVVEHGEPVIVNTPRTDGRFFARFDERLHFKTEAILAVPVTGGGRIIGVIEALNRRDSSGFSPEDIDVLKMASKFAGELLDVILSRAKNESQGQSSAEMQQIAY